MGLSLHLSLPSSICRQGSVLRLQLQNKNVSSELNFLMIYHHGSAQSSLNARCGSRKWLRMGNLATEITYCKITAWVTLCAPIKARILETLSWEACCILLSLLFSVRVIWRMPMMWILLSTSLLILDLNKVQPAHAPVLVYGPGQERKS